VTLTGRDRAARNVDKGVPPVDGLLPGTPNAEGVLDQVLRAPAGQELVLAEMDEIDGLEDAEPPGTTTAPFDVRVADRTVRVSSGGVVLAVAPKGAPVQLVLGDAGHRQSLDLRTGRRVIGIPAMYARGLTQTVELGDEKRYASVRAGGTSFALQVLAEARAG
jgi:hypothetical protein